VVEAVVEELRSARTFNWPFVTEVQARLAEQLACVAPGDLDCVLVVNSGAEAVDSALKLVRLATNRPHVVAALGAWHGFTFGALSVSDPARCRPFGPLLTDVTHVAYGDAAAIDAAIGERTGAVILEPIQAEYGAVVPPEGYLREVAALCRRRGAALILDEVRTGLGRTGRLFACDHEGVVPDILLLGKALGGGVMPVGAIVARRWLWDRFGLSFPMSSSSAAGNAPACAEDEGSRLAGAVSDMVQRYPEVVSGTSGKGLLLALHTPSPRIAAALIRECARRGVLVMTAFCHRTRVLIEPPLVISGKQVDDVISRLSEGIEQMDRGRANRDHDPRGAGTPCSGAGLGDSKRLLP